jgi:F0F1-type ATP synthase delta subunit
LPENRQETLREAAAWLIATGRTRQVDYLVQDVAMVLAQDGYLAARVTTARPIDTKVKREVEGFLSRLTQTERIELTTDVDTDLLGGLRLETPNGSLDTSLRTKLTALATLGGDR